LKIAILGAGVVGSALALALQKLHIEVVIFSKYAPPKLSKPLASPQIVALNDSSIQLLHFLGIDLQQCQTYRYNAIALHCNGQKLELQQDNGNTIGKLIAYNDLNCLLFDQIAANPQIQTKFCKEYQLHVNTNKKAQLTQPLQHSNQFDCFVIAEGKNSHTRSQLAIATQKLTTVQSAICGIVTTQKPLQKKLYQNFTSRGTVALLPLAEHYANKGVLIWCLNNSEANETINKAQQELLVDIAAAFELNFGAITAIEHPVLVPIERQLVIDNPIKNIVFIGDSMQSLHPLAGQGLNFGLSQINWLFELFQMQSNLTQIVTRFNNRVSANAMNINSILELINDMTINNSNQLKSIFKLIEQCNPVHQSIINYANQL